MAIEHIIPITDGVGSKALVNGTYSVTTNTVGYDNVSINPSSQEIIEGTNEYSFTIAATGTLTLHISDDGTETGNPIERATFSRCDASGNVYGTAVTSDATGNAVFDNVPFAETNAPLIYYKQTLSDGSHTYDEELKNTSMTTNTSTVEIQNPVAPTRTINLTDTNYEGLPLESAEITLTN